MNNKNTLTNILLLCCGLFLVLFPPMAEAQGINIQVTIEDAVIHLTPSTEAQVISHPPIGAVLKAESKTGEWFQVSFQSQDGFIVRGYIHERMVRVLEMPPEPPEAKPAPQAPRRPPENIPTPSLKLSAQKPPQSGFWMRTSLGYSPLAIMKSEDDDKVSGGAAAAIISLGAFINERFVIYGDIVGDVITGPTLELNGRSYSGNSDISASMMGVGIGAGYYLIPNSLFAGISLITASLSIEHKGRGWEGSTNPGVGLSFQIGKDFRLSRKCLLGFAGHAFLGTMKDKDNGPQWTTTAAGITASLTWVPRGLAPAAWR